MKSIFKKIAFVLALVMVVTMLPANTVSAASDGPDMYKTLLLYLDSGNGEGSDITDTYKNERYASVWGWRENGYTEVTFESADPSIATVNSKGKVTAVKVGKTTITATFTGDDVDTVVKECVVTVKRNAAKVGLSSASTKQVEEDGIAVGEKVQLTAVRKDVNGNTEWNKTQKVYTTDSVRFLSLTPEIFTVTKTTGMLTAVKEGEGVLKVWTVQSEGRDTNGEYPEVVSKEYKVKVYNAGILSAKQLSLTSLAITCGNADTAAAIAKDPSKLSAVYLLGENKIQTFIKSAKVDAANEKIVNVELYSEITKDTTYNFTYEGKTVSLVGVDPDAVVSIVITNTTAVSEEETTLKVNFLNENGVIINGNMDYVTFTAPDSVDYFLYDGKIYFNAVGKQAVVTATYDRGYDEKGNELPKLTATATIVSVAYSTANNMLGWAVADKEKAANGLTYSTGAMSISVGDTNIRLYGKYNVTLANGNEQACYTYSDDIGPTEDGAVFEYTSTNDAVVMVDMNSGVLHPASAGAAQIIVKRVYSDTNKPVVGVCTINVASSRTLANFTVQPDKTKLAKGTNSDEDTIKAIINPTDQLGGTGLTDIKYTIKVVSSLPENVAIKVEGASTVTLDKDYKEADVAPSTSVNGWQTGYVLKADKALNKITNVQLSITATQQSGSWKSITRVISFQVKDVSAVDNKIATYSLDLSNANIDMNIPSFASYEGMGRFESKIELRAYDSQGFYKALLPMTAGTDTPKKDEYSYTVSKGNENKIGMVTNHMFRAVTVKTVSGTAVDVSSGTAIDVIDKGWNTGTYTVKVYQGVMVNNAVKGKVIAFKNITVKDTTVIPTATVSSTTVIGTDEATLISELTDKITFFRNGSNITDKVTIVEPVGTATRIEADRVYVDKLLVREEITNGGDDVKGKYFQYEVFIGKVFYVR